MKVRRAYRSFQICQIPSWHNVTRNYEWPYAAVRRRLPPKSFPQDSKNRRTRYRDMGRALLNGKLDIERQARAG